MHIQCVLFVITVDYLTIQNKTQKGCCAFNQKLTTTLARLTKINIKPSVNSANKKELKDN